MFKHGLHAFFWAIRVLCSTAGSSEPRLTPRGGRVSAAAADDPDVDVDLPDGPVDHGSQVDGDDGEELIDDLGHWSAVVEVRIDTDMEILTRPPDLDSHRFGTGPLHDSCGRIGDHVAQSCHRRCRRTRRRQCLGGSRCPAERGGIGDRHRPHSLAPPAQRQHPVTRSIACCTVHQRVGSAYVLYQISAYAFLTR